MRCAEKQACYRIIFDDVSKYKIESYQVGICRRDILNLMIRMMTTLENKCNFIAHYRIVQQTIELGNNIRPVKLQIKRGKVYKDTSYTNYIFQKT